MPDIDSLRPRLPPAAAHHVSFADLRRYGVMIAPGGVMTAPVFDRFIPPENFANVEDYVYRSGEPESSNLPFLETLGLRTVIWLAAEEPKDAFSSFIESNNITFHHLGLVEGAQPWDPLTEEVVRSALELIVDTEKHPTLICCGMGRNRTGTVVGCLRRLQGWNLASALEEYRRFTGPRRTRIINELHIEAFQRECVTLSDRTPLPRWLWWSHDQQAACDARINGL